MNMSVESKERVKKEIVARLSVFPEVRRVVVFGSFVTSEEPHDVDIAVFQDSDESYYPLAMKYRKTLRHVAGMIPLDVIPVHPCPKRGPFFREIEQGEVLYIIYADENLDVSALTLEHGHLNACLQNAQQAVEKYLKAAIVERDLRLPRTHSARVLVRILGEGDIIPDISDDEIDFMDAICIPSKYPVYSALPRTVPDHSLCREALDVALRLQSSVRRILQPEQLT